jgi:sterol desaturase/sphingolipid hydroxylase (fatty acid hydroxylase superfamily)
MLKPQYISIPIFALLIAVEAWFLLRQNKEFFDRKDTWTNIALGFGSVGFGLIFGLFNGLLYLWIYEVTPFKMPMNAWWAWVILLFADDFFYYWFHRISHESRFFWNFHVVHHSSNKYNLSVAVRQSWFSGVAHWVFYLPLALMGFPLWAYLTMHGFNLIYQFWIHTELVGKLPKPVEFIFNTPSHHRVHHGVNYQYQDKNYAGIFMFWDRMFGTFVEEDEKVRYGITTPLTSYNWLWINSHAWAEMWSAMKAKKTIFGKLRCIYGSPNMNFAEAGVQKNPLSNQPAKNS